MADQQPIIPTDYWADYAKDAQTYLNRPNFTGSPLTGPMLAQAAHNAFHTTGNTVPIELALAQGQYESHLGTDANTPKRPNKRTNPFNVGEFDSGTKMTFPTTEAGVQAYFNLVAKDYLRKKQMADLMKSFTNYQNNRYASDPDYEKKISTQADYITRFLDKRR